MSNLENELSNLSRSLSDHGAYISMDDDKTILLDGHFTVNELQSIVEIMNRFNSQKD